MIVVPAGLAVSQSRGGEDMYQTFRLAYCDFGSNDVTRLSDYYGEILGATEMPASSPDQRYFSFGFDDHNIRLFKSERVGFALVGLQLRKGLSVAEFTRILSDKGLAPRRMSDARSGVADLVEVDVAGHRLQFIEDMAIAAPGFGRSGIVPNRIGHLGMISSDATTLVSFFTEVLGFHKTDWFENVATFLTCNHDHHVINVVSAPVTKLHHIAFELRGPAHQYTAADLLAKRNIPLVWGPARHTAGHNYASYHYDPDHTLIELYADMDVYLPDVGYMEPRPWHDLPQYPREWPLSELTTWGTPYEFDFAKA
ncbi:MAG: glyoxalase/bleomycin resistance/extradiol dioxygenase family protein [Rhodobacteraceae bacterium]|nr:glyoxalase/bleomycin resistance/extradiol dioxygenase family protein [Paracoccaceae bacterium]